MPKKDKDKPAEKDKKEEKKDEKKEEKAKDKEKSKHPFLRKSLHLGKSKSKKDEELNVPVVNVSDMSGGASGGGGVSSGGMQHLGPPAAFETIRRAQLEGPLMTKERSPSSRLHPKTQQQLEKLPPIEQCKPSERTAMLIEKLRQCSVIFNLEDPLSDLKSKEIKREALIQCVTYIRATPGVLTEPVYDEFFAMYKANVFRVLGPPSVTHGAEYDPEEDEPVLEPAFPHLQLVYDMFLQVIESPDFQTSIASRYIHENFITNLLDLFNSEDPRERDLLKSTLHRVYGRFLQLRAFIRRSIRDIFLKVVYERPSTFNGIAELLEILGSVINGFTVPIKEEHKHFLLQVLIPLHKVKSLSIHLPQLAYCVVQYIEKDPAFVTSVVNGLLRIWPRVNSPKEVMFLNEIDEIIEKISFEELCKVKVPLFKQLSQCIASPHFQVAERALYFWNNDSVINLLQHEGETLMPIICPTLFKFSKVHWNRSIHQLIFNALKIMMELDGALFDRCSRQYQQDIQKHAQQNADRARKWNTLEVMAEKNPHSALFEHHSMSVAPVDDVFSTDELEEALRGMSKSDSERRMLTNNRLRRKSFLPTDPSVVQALQAHEAHKIRPK